MKKANYQKHKEFAHTNKISTRKQWREFVKNSNEWPKHLYKDPEIFRKKGATEWEGWNGGFGYQKEKIIRIPRSKVKQFNSSDDIISKKIALHDQLRNFLNVMFLYNLGINKETADFLALYYLVY